MKVIPTILTYFFVSEISAYKFTKIHTVGKEKVQFVKFDGKGNTYVVTESKKLYKLNPSNEMSSIIYLPYSVDHMLVGKRGDVYFGFVDEASYPKLGILPKNSAEIEGLYGISRDLFYLDKNDNFFYGQGKGVYVIRPNSTTSVRVKNLENFTHYQIYVPPVSDKSSNIYMLVEDQTNGKHSLALITKETLQEEIPHATIIYTMDVSARTEHLMMDEKDRLWITMRYREGKGDVVIKRFEDGNTKTIMAGTEHLISLVRTKERIYVAARHRHLVANSLYYITEKDEVIKIPGLQDIPLGIHKMRGLVNSEEQAYFYATFGKFTPSLGSLISITSNETKVIPIFLSADDVNVGFAKLDFNEDLWILSPEGLFHLIKGETVARVPCNFKQICDIPIRSGGDININFITKRIYISCSEGLITVETLFK